MTMHMHPHPVTTAEERCRHLAIQNTIVSTCCDCGTITAAFEQITGLPVRGDLSDLSALPVYYKDS